MPPYKPYRTLTVYAFPSHKEAEPGFDFVFHADAYDGEWPYLISRSVLTDGKRSLDEILDSHPDSSTDDLFRDAEMGELLKLVVNAVLYTTSADYRLAHPSATGLIPRPRGPQGRWRLLLARPHTDRPQGSH